MRDDRYVGERQDAPASLEAEQSVLGSLLLDNLAYERIADKVVAADFYAEAHRLIFARIADLLSRGKAVDVVTVNDALAAAGEIARAGGIVYLGELLAGTPTAANAAHYAGIVRDRAVRRRLAALGATISGLALARDGRSAADLLDEMRREVDLLSDDAAGDNEPVLLQSLLPEVAEAVERRAANSAELPGIPTGLADLDAKLLGLHPGEVIVVAGETGTGKTTLAMNFALHAAMARQVPVLVFSLEMRPRALAERSIATAGAVNAHAMRGGRMAPEDWERFAHGIGRLQGGAPILIDKSPVLTAERIRARAKRAKRKHGIGLVVVDYLQLVTGVGDTRNEQVAGVSRAMKLLANELDAPILLLSQLNRANAQRASKRPVRSDLRDSGAVEQDADVILFVYREELHTTNDDELKGKAEIIIAKQREGETGTVYAAFIGRYNRFTDTDWRPHYVDAPKARRRKDIDD